MSHYRQYTAMDYYPSSSSHNLPSDLPDLYYDQQDLPSPPSATSSNIISTPPLDWQPWVSVNSKNDNNAPLYQQAPWHLSPLVSDRPIETECDWYQPQQQHHHHPQQQPQQHYQYQGSTSTLGPSSMLFSSYEQQQPQPQPSNPTISHPGPGAGAQSTASSHLGFISAPMAGSAVYSTSPLSHTTPSTPAAVTPLPSTGSSQGTLKLHQPRPSRRIPIVSLSKLALACDDFQIYPKQPRVPPSGQVNLPFTPSSKTYPPMAYPSSNQFNKQGLIHSRNDIYGMGFPPGTGNGTGRSTQCNCGCMAPYLCQ